VAGTRSSCSTSSSGQIVSTSPSGVELLFDMLADVRSLIRRGQALRTKCARSIGGGCEVSKTRQPMGGNHELVSSDSIYSGHSSSQLLDARFSGCRRYLDYLLIRRTLKHAANSSTDQGGGKRWRRSCRARSQTKQKPWGVFTGRDNARFTAMSALLPKADIAG
jgi:hypothetical protein